MAVESAARSVNRFLRILTLLHRWLGVLFCLFFAMWFASGIAMHFVHFPSLTEAERMAGLPTLDLTAVRHGPADAVAASKLTGVSRVRLLTRSDGAIYVLQGLGSVKALRASDLSAAQVSSPDQATEMAVNHAARRGLGVAGAQFVERLEVDQWTVVGGADKHRPLYRIALNDGAGTELYVSSTTGEVLRDTTRSERGWNYLATVPHLIYPTALRKDYALWDASVWAFSLAALITALLGALLGLLRIKRAPGSRTLAFVSPYQGWHQWHHWLGLFCMTFLLTWIVSGWLSMDHGRIFSTGALSTKESAAFTSLPTWTELSGAELRFISPSAREVEWFSFDGRMVRRERLDVATQRLAFAGEATRPGRSFFSADDVSALIRRWSPDCTPAVALAPTDPYPVSSSVPGAPVYRSVCGETWYHVNGATGATLSKLDPSRRTWRWLFNRLHSLEFPFLMEHPWLRSSLIVGLCGVGLVFSLTGVLIGWRRLRRDVFRGA